MEYTTGTAVFNDWIITEKIGQGASGQVFKIKKNGSGEMYSALKVIRIPQSPFEMQAVMSEGMTEDEATDYFKGYIDEICSEIKIMISLKEHPNIVTYESHSVIPHRNEIGWDILIKMELLTPLLNWQMSHPLDENDIIRLGCEMSSALAYVADYNLIHRDIMVLETDDSSALDKFSNGKSSISEKESGLSTANNIYQNSETGITIVFPDDNWVDCKEYVDDFEADAVYSDGSTCFLVYMAEDLYSTFKEAGYDYIAAEEIDDLIDKEEIASIMGIDDANAIKQKDNGNFKYYVIQDTTESQIFGIVKNAMLHLIFFTGMDDNTVLTQAVGYEIMENIRLDNKERF